MKQSSMRKVQAIDNDERAPEMAEHMPRDENSGWRDEDSGDDWRWTLNELQESEQIEQKRKELQERQSAVLAAFKDIDAKHFELSQAVESIYGENVPHITAALVHVGVVSPVQIYYLGMLRLEQIDLYICKDFPMARRLVTKLRSIQLPDFLPNPNNPRTRSDNDVLHSVQATCQSARHFLQELRAANNRSNVGIEHTRAASSWNSSSWFRTDLVTVRSMAAQETDCSQVPPHSLFKGRRSVSMDPGSDNPSIDPPSPQLCNILQRDANPKENASAQANVCPGALQVRCV